MFIRNSWYVAAWSKEVEQGRPFGRMILGEPLVMFRTAAGTVAVLGGRCAHRRMSLVNGKVLGDTLVCCYHGLTYDATGTCIRVPGQEVAPSGIRVRSYPAVERYGAVWVWMGEPARAEPSNIFACSLIDPSGCNGHRFYWHVKANYLYLNDNLSDLLHQAYLHNPSFGGNTDPLGETKPEYAQEDDRIRVDWSWSNVPAPTTYANIGRIKGLADGWNYSAFEPPCFYVNQFGFAEAGTGGLHSNLPQGSGKASATFYQLITPETDRTTHFFKLVHCEWPSDVLPRLSAIVEAVNQEDNWACEEQQRMEDINPAAPRHAIHTDRAVYAMRKVVERLYRDEGQHASQPERRP
jgi:phenylpropionate dioxygenase-like ring-hydroxylating dioxygenase large terminal subunit